MAGRGMRYDETACYIEGLWIARMPADHAWRTTKGAYKMKWNEMNEMMCGEMVEWYLWHGKQENLRGKPTQTPIHRKVHLLQWIMGGSPSELSEERSTAVGLSRSGPGFDPRSRQVSWVRFFRGFSSPVRQMLGSFRPRRSPNIIWPSLSSSIINH